MAKLEGDSEVSAGLPNKSKVFRVIGFYLLTAILGGIGGYAFRPVVDNLSKSKVQNSAEEEVEKFLNCLEGN